MILAVILGVILAHLACILLRRPPCGRLKMAEPGAIDKGAAATAKCRVDGLSRESEQGMRCGTWVPNPQLPPQL
jgi:hypothetical protein